MNSVHFKVVVSGPENEQEIRRIIVDMTHHDCLRRLKEKIMDKFPLLKGYNISIYWIDEEGDEIRINSDDDLVIVADENTPHAYKKIYINVTEKQEIKKNKEPIHPTVTCNSCKQHPLYGFRYKCLVCYDYDLCGDCEKSQSIHTEHPLLRIPVPISLKKPMGMTYENERHVMFQNLMCLLQNEEE